MTPEPRILQPPPLSRHPDFERVADELHSRPAPRVEVPVTISHIALQTDSGGFARARDLVGELCTRYGAPPPFREYFHEADLGRLGLRYEQHTEFYTLTFLRPGEGTTPFEDRALDLVPEEWLARLPGVLFAACHLVVERRDPLPAPAEIDGLFEGQRVRASAVMDGVALVWTCWRTHGDGFVRFYAVDRGMDPPRAGRFVQRILELDTYRMAALLGLPAARRVGPDLVDAEEELARLAREVGETREMEERRALLARLFDLAARIERLIAETAFRFGATRAYAQLVRDRLAELRERRLDPYQPLGQFLRRRFEPAVRTCEAVAERLRAAGERVARTADLVRTRVDVELQEQNRRLLASMERRAALQLRLQQTVEGLSVIVLSYYTVGLLGYLLKGTSALGVPEKLRTTLLALSVPLVVAGVWYGIERFRRRLLHGPHAGGEG